MLRRALVFRSLSIAISVAAFGCGGAADGPPREPVYGAVTFDGKPLEKGLITFTPANGGELVVSGLILDGQFSLTREEGPGLGPHRVDIWSKQATGRILPNPDDPGNPVPEQKEVIPPQFNINSRLAADVAQGGDNKFDYDLRPAAGTAKKLALKSKR
ncbi:hypothetical protein V5E97_09275 [Singulisphaera sp. Ch08]|uniref:Carboxypeptidase regulatory-like domain-containing protein n=1 Tax=Singulisphaera sp. Ch08 TaxID=3120278 RepID=A0AAU7CM74_9BACT